MYNAYNHHHHLILEHVHHPKKNPVPIVQSLPIALPLSTSTTYLLLPYGLRRTILVLRNTMIQSLILPLMKLVTVGMLPSLFQPLNPQM